MQILSHEEAEERYGLTKEDLSEFQLNPISHYY